MPAFAKPPHYPAYRVPACIAASLVLNGTEIAPALLLQGSHPCIRLANNTFTIRRSIMTWSKPEFIDWRFGFEITLYIAKR